MGGGREGRRGHGGRRRNQGRGTRGSAICSGTSDEQDDNQQWRRQRSRRSRLHTQILPDTASKPARDGRETAAKSPAFRRFEVDHLKYGAETDVGTLRCLGIPTREDDRWPPSTRGKRSTRPLPREHVVDEMLAVGLFGQRVRGSGCSPGAWSATSWGAARWAVGSALGDLAGIGAGRKVAGDLHNLPSDLIVGVSRSWVYGATLPGFRSAPSTLLFRVAQTSHGDEEGPGFGSGSGAFRLPATPKRSASRETATR